MVINSYEDRHIVTSQRRLRHSNMGEDDNGKSIIEGPKVNFGFEHNCHISI